MINKLGHNCHTYIEFNSELRYLMSLRVERGSLSLNVVRLPRRAAPRNDT